MSAVILASKSAARQSMLSQAGIEFEAIPADLDEAKIQAEGGRPEDIAGRLAKEKAFFVSQNHRDQYIIGSDQVLSMNNKIYSKAKNVDEAKERLKEFSKQVHQLHSSVCVVHNGEAVFQQTDGATLKMKPLTGQKIDDYCAIAGDVLTQCVGCYALESQGIRLFERIDGDYFTILGMPLLPLINFLDAEGVI